MSPWLPDAAAVGLTANAFIIALAIMDRLISPRTKTIRLERSVSDVLSVGTRNPVTLRATNRSRFALTVELSDVPPEPSRLEGMPARIKLPGGKPRELTYQLRPGKRGRSKFAGVYLRFRTRFGLWGLMARRALETPAKS